MRREFSNQKLHKVSEHFFLLTLSRSISHDIAQHGVIAKKSTVKRTETAKHREYLWY